MRFCLLLLVLALSAMTAWAGSLDEIPADEDGDTWYLPGIVLLPNRDVSDFRTDWMKVRFDHYAFESRDRYNRRAVWPLDSGGISLQAAMVAEGIVLYSGLPGAYQAQMITAEQSARRGKRGLWRQSRFLLSAARLPDQSWHRYLGRFVIVEGKIRATGKGEKTRYLNFGADWKTDFSVSMPKQAGDLSRFVDKQVSVRGWLEKRNGPSLDLLSADWVMVQD